MKCNKKNCPLVGNNENCDIKDCKWRTEDATDTDLIRRSDAIVTIKRWMVSLDDVDASEKSEISGYNLGLLTAERELSNIPAVEPKHGKWIMNDIQCKEDTDNGNYQYTCSECGHGDIHARTQEVPYCWWCGAKMKGADDEF